MKLIKNKNKIMKMIKKNMKIMMMKNELEIYYYK